LSLSKQEVREGQPGVNMSVTAADLQPTALLFGSCQGNVRVVEVVFVVPKDIACVSQIRFMDWQRNIEKGRDATR